MNAGWVPALYGPSLLNTVYNLFSGCHSRIQNVTDKVGDGLEKDRDKLNYLVCFAGKQIQRL